MKTTDYLLLLLAAVICLYAGHAFGHSFYPSNCCSGKDCKPLPAGAVIEKDGGYLVVETNEWYGPNEVRNSPDGEYHRCSYSFNPDSALKADKSTISSWTDMSGERKRPCLWVPPPAF